MSTTVTVKGQVTIPKNMREHLGLRSGDRVQFEFADDGSLRLRPVRKPPRNTSGTTGRSTARSRFASLVGVRSKSGRTAELMDMLRDYEADRSDPGLR